MTRSNPGPPLTACDVGRMISVNLVPQATGRQSLLVGHISQVFGKLDSTDGVRFVIQGRAGHTVQLDSHDPAIVEYSFLTGTDSGSAW